MQNVMHNRMTLGVSDTVEELNGMITNLTKAKIDKEYIIKDVQTNDEDLENFLFTLGCYEGEPITVLSILGENYVISVKDARYSINKELAQAIII